MDPLRADNAALTLAVRLKAALLLADDRSVRRLARRRGLEIDFIVKTGPAAVPVECKANLSVNLRHMRGLIAYLRAHGQHRGYIASLARYGETSVDGARIANLPAYLLERLARGVP